MKNLNFVEYNPRHTSYNEYSANLKSLFKITDSYLLTLSYDYLKQTDVDRFDQVTQRGYEYYKFDLSSLMTKEVCVLNKENVPKLLQIQI